MRKIIVVLFLFFLVWGIVALSVDGLASKPDEVFPMANQHITWMHEKNP